MRILVKSYGCSTNQADGYAIAGCLSKAGHELVNSVGEADVIVYNTCAVKGPTENRVIAACKQPRGDKKLIVTGCLPLINFERLQKEVQYDGVLGPAAGEHVVRVIERVARGEKVFALRGDLERKPSLDLPRIQANAVISVIPMCYGCLGSCSYCCVVHARGRLRSYSVQEIVNRIQKDLKLGFREFWLTAQDTGAFGRDTQTNLPRLLETICSIEGNFKVRVGMMTPNWAMNILEELIAVFKNEKIFKFLHLPVQSGNDDVLKQMHRSYSINDFIKIVERVRKNLPNISLATDVICGFPGENERAFEDTLDLIKRVTPDIVNVSKFFPRPKTLAARMEKEIPAIEMNNRSAIMSVAAKEAAFRRNRQWVQWTGDILVDEIGKIPGSMIGRNPSYKPIVIRGDHDLLGKNIKAEVVKAFQTYLEAKIVE
jgi:threonylcarbamoyladenosine tRNA methylthiotransferase CDKAL1